MLRVAAPILLVLVLVLAGSQVVLPRLAERRLKGDLADIGEVREVRVSAFPALKLLAERADRVEVVLGPTQAGTGDIGDLVDRARDTDELDARVASMRLGRLALRDLRLRKRGDALEGEAGLTLDALRAAVPPGIGFKPVDEGDGQLVLEATAGLLGINAKVRARLSARDGALVVAPEGIPFGGLATLTVFSDPRIAVTEVGARRTADGYALTARGRLNP